MLAPAAWNLISQGAPRGAGTLGARGPRHLGLGLWDELFIFFFVETMTSKTGTNSEKEHSGGAAALHYPSSSPLLFPSD